MSALSDRLVLAVAPTAGYAYIRLLRKTMRLEYRGREHLESARRDRGAFILTFWHSRFVMMPYAYPGGRITVLSSTHKDSELLARVLVRFGFDLSKGSSTRGGAAGLRDIVRKVERGFDVGITPDGPKGPRRRVKRGLVMAARLTGLPIVPVTFSATPARRLRSWDRTLLPGLFARGIFEYGAPVSVSREADDEEQERLRRLVEQDLDRLTDRIDEEMGIGPEDPRAEESP